MDTFCSKPYTVHMIYIKVLEDIDVLFALPLLHRAPQIGVGQTVCFGQQNVAIHCRALLFLLNVVPGEQEAQFSSGLYKERSQIELSKL